MLVAFIRAQHHLNDMERIFDDPYAHRLLTEDEWSTFSATYLRDAAALGLVQGGQQALISRMLRDASAAPIVLSRARYTEERLAHAVARGVEQYVLVGAGLDTFAFRNQELSERLQIFELDHERSQGEKRARLARAGLAARSNLHFAAVDFELEDVATALRRTAFRPGKRTLFAWLGVTYYLTRPAIERTLHALASVAAPGSELVFDSYSPEIFSDSAPAFVARMLERTRALGEPIITGLNRQTLVHVLAASSWSLLEWLDPAEIEHRYFLNREDGFRATTFGQLTCLGVPDLSHED